MIDYDLKNVTATKINQVFYVGAKKTEVLNSIDSKFAELLNYGMFGFISKPLLKLLKLMHDLLGNWGLAIIGMTIIVRAILLPFNVISFKSAQAMQRIKPQMDAIREKYKTIQCA
jgi:YidC/Oxa1 family membrane protein insertase